MGAILSKEQIKRKAGGLRSQGKRIVFTNGCFDLLHVGHTRYLAQAAKLGDVLVVGVNSDASVRKLKGASRPITPEGERAEVLSSLRFVDYVVVFSEERPDAIIALIKPDVHVKGGDYTLEEIPERSIVESYGGKVVILPKVEGRSTNAIIQKIVAAARKAVKQA